MIDDIMANSSSYRISLRFFGIFAIVVVVWSALPMSTVAVQIPVDEYGSGGLLDDGQGYVWTTNEDIRAGYVWTDAKEFVQNSGFNSSVAKQSPYARLPLAAKTGSWCDPPCPVRSDVWAEGQNGAGLYLGFRSDADDIWLNATLLEAPTEYTVCSAVCGSGLDLYAFDETNHVWRWVDTTKNSNGGGWAFNSAQITRSMFKNNARGGGHVGGGKGNFTRYRFHLPIYNGLTSASIGVPTGATVEVDPTDGNTNAAPILWYGTSIVNGHVASRPGMIFTNALSRMLDRPVINLGFGGNGKMEMAVGRLVAEVKQAAMIVIDCNWNMNGSTIATNAPLLVKQLRAEWSSSKPIVLAEGTSAGSAWLSPSIHTDQAEKRAALAAAYAELSQSDRNLHYVKGDDLLGVSGAVDLPLAAGTHPDDLGHHRIAEYYSTYLPPILAGAKSLQQERTNATTAALHPAIVVDGMSAPMEGAQSSTFVDVRTTKGIEADDVAWFDARMMNVGGRADWDGLARENWWDRFPLAAKADVTSGGGGKGIWGLSKCTPSEFVSFKINGNVTALYVSYNISDPYHTNPSGGKLSIMPPLGRNGVDLYGQAAATNQWVWAGNVAGTGDDDMVTGRLTSNTINSAAATRFMLYLPLWRACDNLSIGIPQAEYDEGARLEPDVGAIDTTKKPIVWYGTSILHGAASTRAGASFSNRVQRTLNRTVFNFGFSGSGHMDIGIALWLAKIDAAVYIIDCSWNMGVAEIAQKTAPIVNFLREKRPDTPIVLADGTPDGAAWFFTSASTLQLDKTAALYSGYETCIKNGTKDLYFVNGSSLFGSDTDTFANPTVGGCHPSDLGTADVAAFWSKFLPTILN
eukprot:m.107095 g.107095  ORF g.107095 m.107095 type:complete len:858 (-) comp27770_c0_seq2:220-2793(-)